MGVRGWELGVRGQVIYTSTIQQPQNGHIFNDLTTDSCWLGLPSILGGARKPVSFLQDELVNFNVRNPRLLEKAKQNNIKMETI